MLNYFDHSLKFNLQLYLIKVTGVYVRGVLTQYKKVVLVGIFNVGTGLSSFILFRIIIFEGYSVS